MDLEFLRGWRVLVDLEEELHCVEDGGRRDGWFAGSEEREEEIRSDLRVDWNAVRELYRRIREVERL